MLVYFGYVILYFPNINKGTSFYIIYQKNESNIVYSSYNFMVYNSINITL